jgi:cell division protein FtsQ
MGLAGTVWYGVPQVWQGIRSHPYFALATIAVDGNRRLTRDQLLQWAGLRQGMSAWDATPGALRMRLESHPWIRHASVRRELPRRLRITVRERRPVAIAQLGVPQYVDVSGRLLGPLRADDSRDFPIITGLQGASSQGFTAIAVHRALRLLRWCARIGCFDAVSEVHVDRYRGVTVFPLRPAVAVVLGWGSWREKLARSARIFATWEGQVGRVAVVDVSFRDLAVVKLRQESHPAAGRVPKRGLRV